MRLILETRVRLMRLIWNCQCQEPREKHAAHLLCLVSLLSVRLPRFLLSVAPISPPPPGQSRPFNVA